MRIHYLQHAPFEGPAHLSAVARERGDELAGTKLFTGEPFPDVNAFDILVVLGGPMGVHDAAVHQWLTEEKRLVDRSIRAGKGLLGICLGAQLIADVLGAPVYRNDCREIGWFPLERTGEADRSIIGRSLPGRFYAFHWHGDTFDIPAGAVHIAQSTACRNQGFVSEDRVAALQFHLEATSESISSLIDNCRDEMDGSQFVQNEQEILIADHIDSSNRLFEGIVSRLMDVISGSEQC